MEESHAKLRDRSCLEDRPSVARGLYLQVSACCSEARVLFKYFPFGECGNPATLVVWRFQFIYQTIYIHLDKAILMSHNVFRNIRVAKKEQRT